MRELTGWGRVIAARRRLGVIGFAYLAVHFAIFVLFDRQASLTSTVHEIVTRRYLWFGAGALVLMVPLAVTSTDAMVARLGPIAWKRLHRLAYLVAIGAVDPLLPAREVRRRAAAGVRRGRRLCCCSIAWADTTSACARAAAVAARRRATDPPARAVEAASLVRRARRLPHLRRDARRQDVPARGRRRRAAAVHPRRRPVPQPGADDRRDTRSTGPTRSRRRRPAPATARSRSSGRRTATARATCTTTWREGDAREGVGAGGRVHRSPRATCDAW